MTLANIAYLAMVLAAYAVFMLVLGAYWLRSALEPKPRAAKIIEVTPAHVPAKPAVRRAA